MYERFYHLRERPFALSPDPDYLYPSRVHQEALDYLRYGLETHAGFVVITGEIGSGKTTLLQSVLRTLDTHTTVARLVNTLLDPREVLEALMVDLGLDPSGKSKPLMLRDLAQFLVDQRMQGRLVLVVIDEAQNLSAAALEELRMLSNLETEKSKLLQMILVGQPSLREKLNSQELEQLRQRITVSYHLRPLDADDTARYINHRLRHAAVGAPLEFPHQVTDLVHARSKGIPRIINVICDAVLVFGYAEERHHIDRPLVEEALKELEVTGVLPAETAATDTVDLPAAVAAVDAVAAVPVQPAASVAAPSAMELAALRAREEEIQRREDLLRQRERELLEQRRILTEEYRLLHRPGASRTGTSTAIASPSPVASAPVIISSASSASSVVRPSAGLPLTQRATTPPPAYLATAGRNPAVPTGAATRETFWTRLRRLFLGLAEV
ncbi:MAG: XrtA/PEP-CTERM system-associated ATPase [Acidobacteriota bacterium]